MQERDRSHPDATRHRTAEVERLLSARAMQTPELLKTLGVSQPTLSRTIQQLPGARVFRVKGERTPYYGCLRSPLALVSGEQGLYQIDREGAVHRIGDTRFLTSGQTFLDDAAGGQLFDGLPPAMAFASPVGFLGRLTAQALASEAGYPSSLRDWSDDHRIAYLATRGWNCAGQLVFGDAALALALEMRKHVAAVPTALKAAAFRASTMDVASNALGSIAGGEQPKFLALTEDHGHVIVKFARAGSRMAELLHLERLALQCLAEVDVPAAHAHTLATDDFVFLEVERFDRCGPHGRIGMISAGAVDDEAFGRRDSWSQFAERAVAAGFITAEDARRVHVMAAFSELIGNTDRHFDNLSLMVSERGTYDGISPAYDVLPMRYAPLGAGVDPELVPIDPRLGAIGGRAEVWTPAARAARAFWTGVAREESVAVSAAMRELAGVNLRVVEAFVAPLAR